MAVLNGPHDPAAIKQELAAAGYNGERVVYLAVNDVPRINAIAEVGADMLRRIGMNVDEVAADWGTVVQRSVSRQPLDKGVELSPCSPRSPAGSMRQTRRTTTCCAAMDPARITAGRWRRSWKRCVTSGYPRPTPSQQRSLAGADPAPGLARCAVPAAGVV